jgi:hypothetical protein
MILLPPSTKWSLEAHIHWQRKLFNNADDDYKKDVSLGSKLELPLTEMVTAKPPLKRVSDPNGVR